MEFKTEDFKNNPDAINKTVMTPEPKHAISQQTTAASLLFSQNRYVYATIACLALCCVVGTVGFLSTKSLPGQLLYIVKTGIVEKVIAQTKFSSDARIAYDTQRLKTRLMEMKALSNTETVTPAESLSPVVALIETHTEDAIARLNVSQSHTAEEEINALAQLVFITKAEETLADNEEKFKLIEEDIQTTRRSANNSLELKIQEFASTSEVAVVDGYLSSQISDIATDITKVARGSEAERFALTRVKDAKEALADGHRAEAIIFILRAKEAIAVDQYLWNTERGPVPGVSIESTAIPAGN